MFGEDKEIMLDTMIELKKIWGALVGKTEEDTGMGHDRKVDLRH